MPTLLLDRIIFGVAQGNPQILVVAIPLNYVEFDEDCLVFAPNFAHLVEGITPSRRRHGERR